jgi:hypothetical protein
MPQFAFGIECSERTAAISGLELLILTLIVMQTAIQVVI